MTNNKNHSRDFSSEFRFSASRSGGAGGQNVNKVNTKVELRFSITESQLLTDNEKELLLKKLKNRITTEGELIIVSQTERSQLGNRRRCVEKFYALLKESLTPPKKRKPTKPTRASKERRLEKKRYKAIKKELRKKPRI
ncbi:MAG TPA: alternative ribosome rescue aminoacyl-tRNA hydrolase ArfB [Perlabentimonas sp.]|nr:alternative ribosome rescue aminoacyl-tRNA hydrolase ArfB [Bacteroidales bacterium]MDY0348792.1 alternative ribosome rescue aminoacyl-tRNA hydrolase ArfB [Tenuifilaceae bacterium]HZJ74354.1 alternative ribosome rescue aminoacyl-tRNA hydrolase ArfB [Perlabentimonas sp.]